MAIWYAFSCVVENMQMLPFFIIWSINSSGLTFASYYQNSSSSSFLPSLCIPSPPWPLHGRDKKSHTAINVHWSHCNKELCSKSLLSSSAGIFPLFLIIDQDEAPGFRVIGKLPSYVHLSTSAFLASLGPTGNLLVLGWMSWSKMDVGIARVATAFGASTMPEILPSQGQQDRRR